MVYNGFSVRHHKICRNFRTISRGDTAPSHDMSRYIVACCRMFDRRKCRGMSRQSLKPSRHVTGYRGISRHVSASRRIPWEPMTCHVMSHDVSQKKTQSCLTPFRPPPQSPLLYIDATFPPYTFYPLIGHTTTKQTGYIHDNILVCSTQQLSDLVPLKKVFLVVFRPQID